MLRCVFDLEADGLLDTATTVWCGVFKDIDTGEVLTLISPAAIMEFMDTCDTLIGHNIIGYDFPLLKKLYGYEYKGEKVDTLLMSRLQRPDRPIPYGCRSGPNSVEAWGLRFRVPKVVHEDWSKLSPEMLHRCEQDVQIQHRIYQYLLEEGRNENWTAALRLTHKLFEILQLQEEYGWLVDQEYMHSCIHTLTRWMEKIDSVIVPMLPRRCVPENELKKPFLKSGRYTQACMNWMNESGYNPDERVIAGPLSRVSFPQVDLGSNQQVKEYLLSQGWIPQQWNMKDGRRTSPKLNHDESFDGIEAGIGRLIARRVQCRHRRSQIEGWFKLIREDGRISQRITGIASTGRLTHGGIVNVPGPGAFFGKQMRKIFIAKEGYKLVGVDAAGCQNRMLAARVNDPAFTKILLDGNREDKTSIHYVNMAAIKKASGLDVSYKVCKNLNYAFMFGARDPKLASTAGVPLKYGELIRKGLLSVSPGLEALIQSLQSEWNKGKTIVGIDGRPIMIEKEHTILVYMLQSDEAITMQVALCFLYKWCCDRGWTHGIEYGFVGNIHDEIQGEVREDLAEEFAAMGRRAIATAGEFLKINCPQQGESSIGMNWCDTH